MKIKKWHIIVTVVLLGIVVYFVFFRKTGIPVKEIKIKNEVVKRTVSATGSIKSRNEASLSFASLGRVLEIAVEKGEIVEKGDYIAVLDNYTETQTTQALRDARDAAKRDLELFIENYETKKQDAGGEDEYEIQKRKYEELLSKAEAAYQAQLGTLSKTYIYAPFNGKVIEIYKEEGETVAAGTNIVKIADEEQKIFEIELDQEDFGYLEEGQEVEIELDAYEDELFPGNVNQLPSYVETEDGGDFVIEIDLIDEQKEKALLGMTGDAFIILAKTDSEVKALTFDEIKYDIEDEPYVYVYDNGRVEKLYIELGLKGDIYTEVITEIEKPIIQESDAKFDLEEGIKVKLVR